MSNRKTASAQPSEINIDAEQALLGCVLRRDQTYFEIHNEIEEGDFYDPRHRLIWRTISKIATSPKGRFNPSTVADFLKGDETVPLDYLDALVDAVADPSALMSHVRAVVDLSRVRAMIQSMDDAKSKLRQRDPKRPLHELVDEINGEILDASRAGSTGDLTLAHYAMESMTRIDNVARGFTKSDNFRWGLQALDNKAGPALPGHLHIIGGRSEMGKSSIALQAALEFGRQAPGAIFSLEMRGEGLGDRSLSQFTGIPAWRITRNEARNLVDMESYIAAIEELERLPIYVVARPGLTSEQIRARAIGLARRHGCRWFIVDHLQIIAHSQRHASPSDTIDAACRDHAALAKELNAVWVDLSQVNSSSRDTEHDRPKSRSLMWFNSIEPHADLIVFPWRPEVALAERKPAEPIPGNKPMEDAYATWKHRLDEARGKAEIVIAKNRHGESNVWEACGWSGETMEFTALRPSRQNDRYQGEF